MKTTFRLIWVGLLIALGTDLFPQLVVSARGPEVSGPLSSYDVVAAVNALRAQNGLSAYSVNSILMGTAQAQADYMASIGTWTHTGPGGISVTDRLLAARYPLAGDISLGGFRSENVVMGSGMTAAEAVASWTTDTIHLHTMLSTDLQDIGAGVAEAGGMVYYVIDCARPTASGAPPASTPGAEAAYSEGLNDIIIPVSVSTPNLKGEIIHEIKSGQTLWQIAVSYGVKIDDIRKLNQLATAYVIQPGDKLMVKLVATATAEAPTFTDTARPTGATPTASRAAETPTSTAIGETPTRAGTAPASGLAGSRAAVAAIIVTALVAAGLVAWAGRSRPI
jgi:LysM repeat protein